MARKSARKGLSISIMPMIVRKEATENVTSYQAFLNGLFDFLNLHFTKSFNLQEGLACGAMD